MHFEFTTYTFWVTLILIACLMGAVQGTCAYLVLAERKCAHLYFYYADPDFGLLHIRVQTWLPFSLQVCVNGREWLARQLRG